MGKYCLPSSFFGPWSPVSMKGKDAAHGLPAAQPAHESPHFSLAMLLRRPTLPFRGRLDHHPRRRPPGVGEFFLQFPCDVDLFSAWWYRGPCRFREGRPATCRCVPPPRGRQYHDCLLPPRHQDRTPERARRPACSESVNRLSAIRIVSHVFQFGLPVRCGRVQRAGTKPSAV